MPTNSLLASTGPYFKSYFNNPDSVQIGTMVSVLEIVSVRKKGEGGSERGAGEGGRRERELTRVDGWNWADRERLVSTVCCERVGSADRGKIEKTAGANQNLGACSHVAHRRLARRQEREDFRNMSWVHHL